MNFSAVCIYKGSQYTQGQRWQDGCDFNCECTNAQTGYYRCTEMYVLAIYIVFYKILVPMVVV